MPFARTATYQAAFAKTARLRKRLAQTLTNLAVIVFVISVLALEPSHSLIFGGISFSFEYLRIWAQVATTMLEPPRQLLRRIGREGASGSRLPFSEK